MIRHGDVQIIEVNEIPEDAKKLEGRKELAYGEVTGHAHRVKDLVGDLFETKNGDLYLKVDELSNLTHEEHKTIPLKQKKYRVVIKRQYNAEHGWDRVAD